MKVYSRESKQENVELESITGERERGREGEKELLTYPAESGSSGMMAGDAAVPNFE